MTGTHVTAPGGAPEASEYPLFAAYPGLQAALTRAPLGSWPTPVEALPGLGEAIGVGALFVKRDDVSAEPYGGNKVRKLELLLGDALERGARSVITFGAAGSNHALATAIYGTALGLDVTSILTPQPNASYVRRNLLAHLGVGGAVRMHADRDSAVRDAATLRASLRSRDGAEPYVIPFGGTTPMSTAGFVSAGVELAGQIERGELPEPDVLYVALGSMGTAAGIALGLALAGVRTTVRAVGVVPPTLANRDALGSLLAATAGVLHSADPTVPADLADQVRIDVVEGFLGEEYARFTEAGMEAVRMAARLEDLHLEGTYTGKTMSALVAEARAGALRDATVLFWDTYNSRETSALTAGADYRDLPAEARAYFESDVQPLDAGRL